MFEKMLSVVKAGLRDFGRTLILSKRYRNQRKRFGLRFNLIAAIYNLELKMDN